MLLPIDPDWQFIDEIKRVQVMLLVLLAALVMCLFLAVATFIVSSVLRVSRRSIAFDAAVANARDARAGARPDAWKTAADRVPDEDVDDDRADPNDETGEFTP